MGPCEWPILPRCPEWDPEPAPGSAAEANQARAEALAVDLLWSLTARVFGVCDTVIRPCFHPPNDSTTYRGREGGAGPSSWPGLIQGTWVSGACGCRPECKCLITDRMLALPAPIVEVTEVYADGAVLDPGEYLIKDNRWLVRVGASWPQDQNLEVGDNEPGAFTVKYRRGVVVPLAGQYAAGDLACELLRGLTGGACALPARAVSVARQGIDIQLLDPAQYLDGGLTGVPSVDAWIKSTNPAKAYSRPKVFNPDQMGYTSVMRPGGL